MNTTIHYMCFYSDEKTHDKLKIFPSSVPKIDYISKILSEIGFNVKIYSTCQYLRNNSVHIKSYRNRNGILCHYQYPIFNYGILGEKLNIILSWIQIFLYILFRIKRNDKLLLYHSMFYYKPILLLSKIFRVNFILEVEELYYSLFKETYSNKEKEISYIKRANAYLLVNDLLIDKIGAKSKKNIVSYSTYKVPDNGNIKSLFSDHKIHIVYAGIIERYRNAAFFASKVAKYLPNNYVIHILGFGVEQDIQTLNSLISEINSFFGYEKVRYEGVLYGEEYSNFLFNCHIGLNCHTYDESVPESADCTFPSKVVVYLSHNLRVVSLPLRCLEQSTFANYIKFSTDFSLEAFAESIMSLDCNISYDSRGYIAQLHKSFKKEMLIFFQNL